MKNLILIVAALALSTTSLMAQSVENKPIYNPQANAEADLNAAIKSAAKMNKHVLIQVGGNWCPWCVKMHKFIHSDAKVDSMVKADYIWIKINYSKENKNLPVLARLEYPQRFGFPVLVVLDKNGKRLHTQDTGFLEDGKGGYSEEKLVTFLKDWTVKALDPSNYMK